MILHRFFYYAMREPLKSPSVTCPLGRTDPNLTAKGIHDSSSSTSGRKPRTASNDHQLFPPSTVGGLLLSCRACLSASRSCRNAKGKISRTFALVSLPTVPWLVGSQPNLIAGFMHSPACLIPAFFCVDEKSPHYSSVGASEIAFFQTPIESTFQLCW